MSHVIKDIQKCPSDALQASFRPVSCFKVYFITEIPKPGYLGILVRYKGILESRDAKMFNCIVET